MKAILTTLKLAVPAAVVLLLAGCITDPYAYRGGYGGDYYYGQPSVEYRHHGYYGGYYGHPYYGRSGWSFGMQYGYPYGYGGYGRYGYGRYGYGGWPYYRGGGWPHRPPVIVRPHPDPDPDGGHGAGGDPQGPPPWRDLDRLRDRDVNPPIPHEPRMPRTTSQPPRISSPDVSRPPVVRQPRPQVERQARPTGGSRMERVQRAMEDRDQR